MHALIVKINELSVVTNYIMLVDNFCWPGNDVREKCLLEQLVNTIGTEIEIRTRQRWLLIRDMIETEGFQHRTVILSGSLAEGLDLPGSDIDIMIVLEKANVLQNIRDIKHPTPLFTLVMETETNHPGFTRLKSIDNAAYCFEQSEFFESTREGVYKPVNGFVNEFIKDSQRHLIQPYQHGP
ncbi:unnamed protein product [Mytilus coruscus]|uniref:Polymerase nucleotidyl transferase domain-containing protein n=1 Tax=Mytilus coruscus TaxID=42192 RepID=A0A6J8AQA2_MYTCO|nr:unnamed protein product [Mytilus coruscus]